MSNGKPIGFFDSGVGLLSILKETQKLLPYENFVVLADQGHNPYGEKSQREIQTFAREATRFLVKNHKIKMMVLACNTATVLAVESLRKIFPIPIVGVVPAIKPAAKKSEKSKIVIMSTPATAKSIYLENLIKKFSPNARVLKLGCGGMEEAIEVLDKKKIDQLIGKYTKTVKDFGADTVVLGCTHYPLIKSRIQNSLPPKTKIIDSGEAVAIRIEKILNDSKQKSVRKFNDIFYTTGDPKKFSDVTSQILGQKIQARFAQI